MFKILVKHLTCVCVCMCAAIFTNPVYFHLGRGGGGGGGLQKLAAVGKHCPENPCYSKANNYVILKQNLLKTWRYRPFLGYQSVALVTGSPFVISEKINHNCPYFLPFLFCNTWIPFLSVLDFVTWSQYPTSMKCCQILENCLSLKKTKQKHPGNKCTETRGLLTMDAVSITVNAASARTSDNLSIHTLFHVLLKSPAGISRDNSTG